jgi:hypothetical protein
MKWASQASNSLGLKEQNRKEETTPILIQRSPQEM